MSFGGILRHVGFRIRLSGDTIVMTMRVPHRDTGELIELHQTVMTPPYVDSEKLARHYLFQIVEGFARHELMESIRFAGALYRDPHAR